MTEKRYHVIFTGHFQPGVDAKTVKANLVLELGLAEEKVEQLFAAGRVVLKRCETSGDAERLAERFDRAGAVCVIQDKMPSDIHVQEAVGESSLVRLMNKFIPRKGQSASQSKGK